MKKSKLKKRLCKKFHLGEFQELGFEIFVNFESDLNEKEFEVFLDELIEVIEDKKLLFGGGGKKHWQGFITSSRNLLRQQKKIEKK